MGNYSSEIARGICIHISPGSNLHKTDLICLKLCTKKAGILTPAANSIFYFTDLICAATFASSLLIWFISHDATLLFTFATRVIVAPVD